MPKTWALLASLMGCWLTSFGAHAAPHPVVERGLAEQSNKTLRFMPQTGHAQAIHQMAFTPDGSTLVTTGQDSVSIVWNTETWAQVGRLIGHKSSDLTDAAFHRDGVLLGIRITDPRGVKSGFEIWDVARESRIMLESKTRAYDERGASAFTFDGSYSVCGYRGFVTYNPRTGKEQSLLQEPKLCEAASKDGSTFVTAEAGSLSIWTGSPPKPSKRIITPEFGRASSVSLNDNGTVLLAYSNESKRREVWSVSTGARLYVGEANAYPLLSPDGKQLALDSANSLRVIDLASGKERFRTELGPLSSRPISAWAFSPDGKRVVIALSQDLFVFDADTGSLLVQRPSRAAAVASISPGVNGQLFSRLDNRTSHYWDLKSLRRAYQKENINDAVFSPDGERMLWAGGFTYSQGRSSGRPRQYVVDAHTGHEVVTPDPMSSSVSSLQTLPGGHVLGLVPGQPQANRRLLRWTDGNIKLHWTQKDATYWYNVSGGMRDGHVVIAGAHGELTNRELYDVDADKVIYSAKQYVEQTAVGPEHIAFSAMGETVLLSSKTLKEVARLTIPEGILFALAFSPDGKWLAGGDSNGQLWLWSLETYQEAGHFRAHSGFVTSLAYSPDGAHLFSGSRDGVVRVFNTKTGESVGLLADGPSWLTYSPDGYFDASNDGGALVAMVSGRDAYAVDQFGVRNNRPDILIERMGLGSEDLVAHFRGLYEQRLRRSGLKEADLSSELHVPKARVGNVAINGKTAVLDLEFSDTRYDMVHYNVFVNDVPLFGGSGKPVNGRNAKLKEEVLLSLGSNKVEVSVVNSHGAESFRARRDLEWKGQTPRTLHFIGFGVSRYADPALNLDFAAKDATDLGVAIRAAASDYQDVRVHTFVDEAVTTEAIDQARLLLAEAKVDDTLVLFIAGHGMHDNDAKHTYYYLTHHADSKRLADTAVTFERLESLLQGITPRKKLLFMDTCESGEQASEEVTSDHALALARGLGARGLRKAATVKAPRQTITHDRSRYAYNDLVRRSGAVVFSSSQGGELSYESKTLGHGLFTQALLDALSRPDVDKNRDRKISKEELRAFVATTVSSSSAGLQNPTIDRDNIAVDALFTTAAVPPAPLPPPEPTKPRVKNRRGR